MDITTEEKGVYSKEVERRELVFPLPTGDQVVLVYPYPMDEESFDHLHKLLELNKIGMLPAKTKAGESL